MWSIHQSCGSSAAIDMKADVGEHVTEAERQIVLVEPQRFDIERGQLSISPLVATDVNLPARMPGGVVGLNHKPRRWPPKVDVNDGAIGQGDRSLALRLVNPGVDDGSEKHAFVLAHRWPLRSRQPS
jgi:hypothetical protein